MVRNYNIVSKRNDINNMISPIHREAELALGIIDSDQKDDLETMIASYSQYDKYKNNMYVVTTSNRLETETLHVRFPDATFIVFDSVPTLAQEINALANTCKSSFFLFQKTNCKIANFVWPPLLKKMNSNPAPAVLAPIIFNMDKELIPTVRIPKLSANEVDPLSAMPGYETETTLYPFLGLGLYNRALFQRIRGYDEEIYGAYWQALDFGIRCWLYGHPILSVNELAFIFDKKHSVIEDRTENTGIGRFYAKALSVYIKNNGHRQLKKHPKADIRYLMDEVKPKSGLYKIDFETLCRNWEIASKQSN